MSKYKMTLNRKYIVSTYGLTYVNKLVEVVGIINYEEALKLDDIKLTGLNEKIIDSNYDDYFQDIEFYKCRLIDDQLDKIIILWSDIIDGGATSVVGEKYQYKASLELDVSTSSISKDSIIQELKLAARSMNATLILTPTASSIDSNTAVDILQQRIKECENVLRSLQALSTITPVLDALSRGELEVKLASVTDGINAINEKITTIAAGLS